HLLSRKYSTRRQLRMTNFKIRFKNPVYVAQFILAIITPILAYAGLTMQDLTSWSALGELLIGAVSNPYVLSMVAGSVWNATNDPKTKGITICERTKSYSEPK